MRGCVNKTLEMGHRHTIRNLKFKTSNKHRKLG